MSINTIRIYRSSGVRALTVLSLALLIVLAATPVAYSQGCVPLPPFATEADRIGFNVVTDYGKGILDYDADLLGAGWFIDYRPSPYLGGQASSATAVGPVAPVSFEGKNRVMLPFMSYDFDQPQRSDGMGYAPVLRMADLDGNWQTFVSNLVRNNPGMLWIIGNEPDRDLQDGMSPEEYVQIYHDVYEFIKLIDPSSKVAIAGVVQPTPLRLRYLDKMLDGYQQIYAKKMPVDVWNVHAFILREVSPGDYPPEEAWGAGIPIGVEEFKDEGRIYDVPDHGDIEIFKQQIRDFRQWMAVRGYRNTPLIVTEYGILMAPDYDAGNGRKYDEAFVSEYMRGTFDFFRTATDSSIGYAADGNRLVQSWSWFGLNNYVYS